MRDMPGMTVEEHHKLCVGVLACCFEYVPTDLQKAIEQGILSAIKMGLEIDPENVLARGVLKRHNNQLQTPEGSSGRPG